MTYKESIVRGRIQSEHAVQLFDSPESLAQTVAGILASRHAEGDVLLVVAKRANWSAIAACLAEGGVDADRLIRSRRLTVLDAAETLDAISRRDVPDPELFENVVGTLVRQRSADRPLTIYGEMVELLAAEADFASALKLEELWNDLSESFVPPSLRVLGRAFYRARPRSDARPRVRRAHERPRRRR